MSVNVMMLNVLQMSGVQKSSKDTNETDPFSGVFILCGNIFRPMTI